MPRRTSSYASLPLPGLYQMDSPVVVPPAPPEPPRFNGADYDPERDDDRLRNQLQRIWTLMRDGRWRTLPAIATATGDPEPSISAQLRHLRKPRFGGHTVERRYVGHGLYEYRVLAAPSTDQTTQE